MLNIPELGLNVFEYIGVPSCLRSNFVLFALLPSNPSYVDKNTSCDTVPYDNFGGVGDGWDGAQVSLLLNGQQGPTFTFANGDSSIVDFQICSGTQVTVLNSLAGSFPSEVSYTLSNASGTQTTSVTTGNFAVGTQATLVANCVPVSCPMPMNITLNNVTSYSAGLTWTGGSGSFIYDYREQGGTNMFNGTSTTPAASR